MKKKINDIIRLLCFYFTKLNFYKNRNYFKKVHKHSFAYFFNDTTSNQINLLGVYEYNELNEIINFIKNKNLCLDIGANIGNHSIFFSKFFKKVYSFEPHPKILPLLKYNVKNIRNIKIFNYGLSDKKKKILISDGNHHHLGGSSINASGITKIKVNKLDNIFKNKKIDFIKIDVEGYELKVLNGCKKILKHNSAILNIEFDAKDFNEKNSIIKFLKKNNYKYFYFYSYNKNDFDGKIRNILFKIIIIMIRGIKEKKASIKNINEFKKDQKYGKNIICSKYKLL